MAGKRLLLVEGRSDKNLHEEICAAIRLREVITVAPPKEAGGGFNSKQGAISLLNRLLPDLSDGQLERFGIVIDADRAADGGGFANTVAQVAQVVAPYGYAVQPEDLPAGGLLFKHNDGLPDIGLWVMPNNRDEGAVEAWISDIVLDAEQALLTQACAAVDALTAPKFAQANRQKAEMATWMAWQDKPGRGLHYAVKAGLLNPDAPLFAGFSQWLARVFR